jgi:hypothetical protein
MLRSDKTRLENQVCVVSLVCGGWVSGVCRCVCVVFLVCVYRYLLFQVCWCGVAPPH